MNFRSLQNKAQKIVDAADQRARHSAINMLVKEGWDKELSSKFVHSLYSRIPALKGDMRIYIEGIVRWFVEGDIDLTEDKDCSRVNTFLVALAGSPAKDALSRNFYSDISDTLLSFNEAKDLVDVDVDSDPQVRLDEHNYQVVQIDSYEELLKYKNFLNRWCIVQSEDAFDSYTINGINDLFLCLRDDYKEVKPTPGDGYPKDSYGLSIIAVIVDPDGNIASTTSRWNNTDEMDNLLTKAELAALTGVTKW